MPSSQFVFLKSFTKALRLFCSKASCCGRINAIPSMLLICSGYFNCIASVSNNRITAAGAAGRMRAMCPKKHSADCARSGNIFVDCWELRSHQSNPKPFSQQFNKIGGLV